MILTLVALLFGFAKVGQLKSTRQNRTRLLYNTTHDTPNFYSTLHVLSDGRVKLCRYDMAKVRDSSEEHSKKPQSCLDAMFGKRTQKYALWFIIMFLTVLTVKDVYDLFVEYFEYPKQSDMTIVFNESMTLPNVTFCMSKKQAYSHWKINASEPADEWDRIVEEGMAKMDKATALDPKTDWDYRLVMEAYEYVSTMNSLERETTAHGSARSINLYRIAPRLAGKRKMFDKWQTWLNEQGISFAELTQKVGTEALRRSMQRWQRNVFEEDVQIKTKLKITWMSMMQLCFAPEYDEENFKAITDQGTFFTFMTSHNAENLNGEKLDCMSVDFHGRPSSLNRFMEGKGRARDGFSDELCPGQRHEVTVEVRAHYSMLANDDDGTACRTMEEDVDSEFDCRSRCRMEMIKEICNCTALTLSYLVSDEELQKYPLCDYKTCVLDVQNGTFSDEKCAKTCFRDCDQIRYDVKLHTVGRMVRPDLTLVMLNWGAFEYMNMEQDWVWSVPSFIGALGGAIGMWLGLSILSLIQGIGYVYNKWIKKVVVEKVLLKDADELSEENASRKGSVISLAANPLASPFGEDAAETKKRTAKKLSTTGNLPTPSYSVHPNPTKIQVDH